VSSGRSGSALFSWVRVNNAHIGDGTKVYAHCRVGSDSRVASRTHTPRAYVGSRCELGYGSVVNASAFVYDDVLLGYKSRVDTDAEVQSGSSYGPYFHAPSGSRGKSCETMLGAYYVLDKGYDKTQVRSSVPVSYPMGIGW
jgi:carbonic anhydrase/acetyltransferase-like protein (isoleucine patch superfamily)